MKLRILLRVLAALVLFYALATVGMYVAMRQPPEKFGAIMAKVPMPAMIVLPFEPLWMNARAGTLNVGNQAADFSLPTLDGSRTVTLSGEYRERPVVLIFGSYT